MKNLLSLPALISVVVGAMATAIAAPLPLPTAPPSPAYGWGDNMYGQVGNPLNSGTGTANPNVLRATVLENSVAIAAGQYHTLALAHDGTVWAWGTNQYGQLGNAINNGSNSPNVTPSPIAGLSDVVAISGGGQHSLALKNDGTVWAWGSNQYSQLGHSINAGNENANPTPVQVAGLSGVTAIAAGGNHSVALKSDGTVWGWGSNYFGQLGNTTNLGRADATNFAPLQAAITGVKSIATGFHHTIVVKNDGSVWGFGWNFTGQIGDTGTAIASATPNRIDGISGAAKVSAGYYHSSALKNDGTVWGWGRNRNGELGNSLHNGTNTPILTATPILGLAGVSDIVCGYFHGLALKSDGTVWSWGRNTNGQLGNNTNINTSNPNPIFSRINSLRNATAISAGQSHSVALSNGAPRAAGVFMRLTNNTMSRLIKLEGTDPQYDTLTYSIVSPPSHGTLNNWLEGYVIYTPSSSFTSSDSFTYKANDGTFDSNIATVSLVVNSAPVLESFVPSTVDGTVAGSGSSVPAGVPLKLKLTVKDDISADHIRMIYLVFNKTLSHNNGCSLAYDPATNQISLRSATGQIVTGQVAGTAGTQSNGLVTLDFSQSTVVKNTADKTITVTWVVTPSADFTGLKGMWAQTRDIYNAVAGFTQLATWTVLPEEIYVSQVKALDGLTVIKPGVTSQPLILPVSNPDGVALNYSIVDAPGLGTLGPVTGNRVVYTPGPDFGTTGRDNFTFKVSESTGESSIATYTVKYNGAPQLGELIVEKVNGPTESATSAVGEPLRLNLTVSDEDGAANIRMIYLLFNKAQSHNNGASLEYDPGTNRIAMRNAAGQLVTGQVAGTPGTQSNGLVTLDFGQSTVVKDPVNKTVTVSWVVTPEAGFTGLKGAWAQVRDIAGLTAGFSKIGEWTVLPAAPTLKAKPSVPSTKLY